MLAATPGQGLDKGVGVFLSPPEIPLGVDGCDARERLPSLALAEFIPDQLYFAIASANDYKRAQNIQDIQFYFTEHLVYVPFNQDFGPMNFACTYKFVKDIHSYIKLSAPEKKRIVYIVQDEPQQMVNGVYLMCAYMMIKRGHSPTAAFKPFETLDMNLIPYRDASDGPSTYDLQLLDCLQGLYKALRLGFIDFDTFDVHEYEFYDQVINGDFNWITPNLIAFASPVDPAFCDENKNAMYFDHSNDMQRPDPYSFQSLLSYFSAANIRQIVRLNSPMYDASVFESHGMQVTNLAFMDGTIPSIQVVLEFWDLCEKTMASKDNLTPVLAVHCKAGLGRTGSLIASWLIRKYDFSAAEAIGFLRIMRPGSVIGQQQAWLCSMEKIWRDQARDDKLANRRAKRRSAYMLRTKPQEERVEASIQPRKRERKSMPVNVLVV